MNMIEIDINNFVGRIPAAHDLVVFEKGQNPEEGYVLYGFDEVGMFDNDFNVPQYAFVKAEC
jgi:hypothetical protein